MAEFPRPIEAGNEGDGSPLTLGSPGLIGDLFLQNGTITLLDWDGDGEVELVDAATRRSRSSHFRSRTVRRPTDRGGSVSI